MSAYFTLAGIDILASVFLWPLRAAGLLTRLPGEKPPRPGGNSGGNQAKRGHREKFAGMRAGCLDFGDAAQQMHQRHQPKDDTCGDKIGFHASGILVFVLSATTVVSIRTTASLNAALNH
jgi:hypothetical protein